MKSSLVSIIIPTYNRGHLIGETLDSVLAQTYSNWECIVVDDGSTDNTQDILNRYCLKDLRIKYFKRPDSHTPGGNGARNYGFELSKGHYIIWFDDDDIMLPQYLSVLITEFEPELDLTMCSYSITDHKLVNPKPVKILVNTSLYKEYVLGKAKVLTPSVLFNRNFLINKVLFNPIIARGQEAELFSRLFFKLPKERYKIINTPLFLYRQHTDTKTHENTIYNHAFKKSVAYFCVENLKKGIILKDAEFCNYMLYRLTKLCYEGLYADDKALVSYIWQN